MKKQIIYPDFIPRIFSTVLDLIVILTIFSPIINFINKALFVHCFKEFLIKEGIKITDDHSIASIIYSQSFAETYSFTDLLFYVLIPQLLLQFLLISIYYLGFWHYTNTTPGKYLLGMRIRDEKDSQSLPTFRQYLIRLFSYTLGFIGIFFAIFNHKHQALHDRLSKTVVVKK